MKITQWLLGMFSITVASCGGGGGAAVSSTQAPISLNGVAAVGTPIVGGSVNIICASGAIVTPVTTNTQGSWSVTLTNQTLPCALEVSGGTINSVANPTSYHSIAIAAGTANITPLTDLIVANMAKSATPSTWFAGLGLNPPTLGNISSAQLSNAFNGVVSALSGLASLSANNPITTSFTPTSGNVSDDMLTALAVALTNTGVSYTTLLSNAAATTFTPVSGFNTALTTAYSATVSGGSSSSGNTCAAPTNLTAQSGTAVWENTTQMLSALSGTWSGCDIYGKPATITYNGGNVTGTISKHTNYYATYTNCTYTLAPFYFFPATGELDYSVTSMTCDQGSGMDTVHGDVFTVYTMGGAATVTSLVLQMDFLNFAVVTHQ